MRQAGVDALNAANGQALREAARVVGVTPSFTIPSKGTMYLKSSTIRERITKRLDGDQSPDMAWAYLAAYLLNAPMPNWTPSRSNKAKLEPETASELHMKQADGKEASVDEVIKSLIGTVLSSFKGSVDEDKVREIVQAEVAKRPSDKLEVKVGGKTVEVKGLRHEAFEKMLKLAVARVPILLVGPAGTGKTHLASQVAEALGLPFSFISVSAGMSEGVLGGRLLPTGEGGRFEYTISEFIKAYETGGVFLLDEIDAGDANVMTFINSATANGHASVPNRTDNPVAKKHADFVLVAAANTFGNGADRQYVGRNQLDAATLDRFKMGTIDVKYDRKLEAQLAPAHITEWGWQVREQIASSGLRKILSTRSMIGATKCEAAGLKPVDWKESYFCDWKADELAKIKSSLR